MRLLGGYRSAGWRLPDRAGPKLVVLHGFPGRSSRFRGESNPDVVDEKTPGLPHGIGSGIDREYHYIVDLHERGSGAETADESRGIKVNDPTRV